MMEVCVAPAVFRAVAEMIDGLIEVHRLAELAFGADRVEPIEFEPDGFDGESDWRAWAFRVSVHGVSVWAWAGYEIEGYGGVECAGCGVWSEASGEWDNMDCETTTDEWFAGLREAVLVTD